MKEIDEKEFDRLYYRDILPLLKTCNMQIGKSRSIVLLFLSIGFVFFFLASLRIYVNIWILLGGVILLWFLARWGSSSYRDYKFYTEIKDIFEIVDALKLDMNIGL